MALKDMADAVNLPGLRLPSEKKAAYYAGMFHHAE